jgi:NADH-quinone oxidoreductase subunit J
MRRPRLAEDIKPAAGLASVALLVVMGAVFFAADFGAPAGFTEGESITEGIGYALFDLTAQSGIPTEGFLFAFLTIAVVLDAALDGAIMLARREEDAEALPDGGDRT